MPVRTYRPLTPSQRYKSVSTFEEITKKKPEKKLVKTKKQKAGRNANGHITARHRGGGSKRKIRIVDFRREREGVGAKVVAIEYDPNRSARIALVVYPDGEKRYVIATDKMQVGDIIYSGVGSKLKEGNVLRLKDIPVGMTVSCVELKIGKGAQIARSAGAGVQLLAKEGKYAHLRLPSGEVRLVNLMCKATIGEVGNKDHSLISFGKAGRKRWLGRRPKVRGATMNPVDHPHGGGEGRSKGGRHPVSPSGVPAKGYKTRKKKPSDKFIVKRRK
ncbi:MAG: 50S ribosomal protein L2 [Candidatus Coatesbacteria bacterium]|nr:MAG: 50S ribosomal protein L2 [Candidatus Coatesbacteria bacterium]RLC41961.1 MAG: 50S ribosomal protein L2 [Candidatus Coatesbacteria bacterium]RLC44708.1 MAG: 50S ribosomal protein L2 [Candidatus Coatesbacteria bacterium]HEC79810.1 50S ribosomal protein L2 [Bacillota bacterium]